jgi:hypothetical protein
MNQDRSFRGRPRVVGALSALLAGSLALVAVSAGPASADSDGGAFRTAFGTDASITLTSDIVLDSCGSGAALRSSSTPVVIQGGGHAITQTCPNVQVLWQTGDGAVTLNNVVLVGGNQGIEAGGNVTFTNSTATNQTGTAAAGMHAVGDAVLTNCSITNVAGESNAVGAITEATLRMTGCTINGVSASDGLAVGAVAVGALTIDDSTITNIDSGGSSNAIGVTTSEGAAALTNSTVSSVSSPGGFAASVLGATGAQLTRSTVINTRGGGDAIGILTDGDATLVSSTVAATQASGSAQAIGIVATEGGTHTKLTNSTITGTTAPGGVAIALFATDATLVYSDIVGNGGFTARADGVITPAVVVPDGKGGVQTQDLPEIRITADVPGQVIADVFTSFASVVAKPISPSTNCFNQANTSNGYNWADDETCGFVSTGDTQQSGGDPMLGPLADNGGPTMTLLPADTSPLVEDVPAAACQADGAAGIDADQRGLPRPGFVDCDTGSVELQALFIEIQPRFTG